MSLSMRNRSARAPPPSPAQARAALPRRRPAGPPASARHPPPAAPAPAFRLPPEPAPPPCARNARASLSARDRSCGWCRSRETSRYRGAAADLPPGYQSRIAELDQHRLAVVVDVVVEDLHAGQDGRPSGRDEDRVPLVTIVCADGSSPTWNRSEVDRRQPVRRLGEADLEEDIPAGVAFVRAGVGNGDGRITLARFRHLVVVFDSRRHGYRCQAVVAAVSRREGEDRRLVRGVVILASP